MSFLFGFAKFYSPLLFSSVEGAECDDPKEKICHYLNILFAHSFSEK
jgi:hypothetical protein